MSVWVTLHPLSPGAVTIERLFVGTVVVLSVLFALVVALGVYAIIKYRDRPGAAEPAQEFGSRRLEIGWTAGAIVVVAALMVFTASATIAVNPPADANKPDLRIVGHQWWWEIDYPDSGVMTANEVHIPAGKRLLVDVEAADVIHDFWVPELGRKIDAIPQHPNWIYLQADRPGTYLGTCAEFCGPEHAWMRIMVVAQDQADFDSWQTAQRAVPPAPGSGLAAAGAQLFREQTCINCHAIAGTGSTAKVGPDLTHISTRQTLASGAAINSADELFKWLKDPDSIKPQSHMPNFQLSNEQVTELVAYLEALK
ncbi:MAG TPA: cytochrome c oxidase subunit II [Candidatus Binataceae bacterium]|nr:cytochrome c oxidase subunit II [Candidatus Binataceae bacterium]